MATEQEEHDGAFMKSFILGFVLLAAAVAIFGIVFQATRADAGRAATDERYVRAHQCVVAYEEHGYAQLYRCGDAAGGHYLKPAELREAAQAELTQAKLH